jgi:hypothetical protein
VQYHSGKFRFVQLNHHRTGKVPLHGVGYITLESAQTHTPPVAATIARLHATPHLSVSAIKTVRVAGIAAEMFDATVVGTDGPQTGNGVSLVPFTTNRHCGFCNDAAKHPSKETQDVKYAGKGQLFRIIVLDARGKTVVIYLESSYADQPRFPPAKTFPTFLPYAQKMLASLHFSG